MRRATVSALQQRFGVDTAQAERVAQAASALFAQATGQEQRIEMGVFIGVN